MFQNAVDIANRALDHCGQDPIDETLGFNEDSKKARLVGRLYDKVRQAELRRKAWNFAIRRAILRPVDTTTMLLSPALWSAAPTYFVNSIVADSAGVIWQSVIPNNANNEPGSTPAWQQYFGPMSVAIYDSTASYFSGELVYTAVGDGTNRVFLSLQNANADNPATATAWSATVTYAKNQVVTFSAIAYMSLVDLNLNQQPSTHPTQWTTTFVGGTGSIKWLQIGGTEFPFGVTVVPPNIVYPVNAGPSTQSTSRNVFMLPAGYLRVTSPDPKAGSSPWLGASWNLDYSDWLIENGLIVSAQVNAILFRFVADVYDVRLMDAMFCEGLGARLALEVCEPLTQSVDKLKVIADIYKKFMGEARIVDGIEAGPEESPADDFVTCRA